MENVVAFNNELSSLYESKPPISKAKMAAITRAAMKAIKFYKHVVQSVEKFILKCKPEYKVPGLYVIDSIVRQSRHQFGTEKDVFAPRFARNMKQTFANLFHCAPDDKSRIIRVLNLWQKNNVFAPEVIQPLFDLADPNHPIYQQTGDNIQDNNMSSISNGLNLSAQDTSNLNDESHFHSQQSDMMMGHQTGNSLDQNTIRQLQQLQQILIRQTNNDDNSSTTTGGIVSSQSDSIKFNKKVLDYDYGDDEEDEKTNSPHTITNILDSKNLTQILKDPNVLRQLQTLQKFKEQEEKQSRMKDINKSQDISYDKHIQGVFKGPGGNIMNETLINVPDKSPNIIVTDAPVIEVINLEDGNDSRSTSPDRDRYKRSRRSSRSKSRDRGGRSDRDRDRDRSRRGGRSRSRSRSSRSPPPSSSRSNRRRSSREKDRNNKEKEREKEYERERRRKGLPDIKKEHLTVCSNTLWVGHLSKLVHQEELSDTFGKYGDIISIDMIYPRGCAFIVMNRRQDAFKAMQNLKNHKLQGRVITISWAAGKGVKSKEWKDYWDLDLGVSYIPWSKLNENTDLEALEEGGMFDEDTMPNWMKDRMNQKNNSDNREQNNQNILGTEGVSVDTSQPPPTAGAMMPGVSLIPPYSAMGPVPRLMPPPLGVPMTGSMVPGLPMPANIVPGIPPPHMMMPPPTGMVSGFAPMPTPLDKPITPSGVPSSEPQTTSVPPSFLGANVGGIHLAPHMAQQQPPFGGPGIPPQFPPPLTDQSNTVSSNVNQGEDHMDIEMEDENPSIPNKLLGNSSGPSVQFSQPPPLFPTFSSELLSISNRNNNQTNDRDLRNANDNDDRNDIEFERGSSRNRDGSREKSVEFGKRDREQNRWSSERSLTGGDRDAQTRVRDRNNMDREKTNNTRTDFNRTGSNQQEQQGRSIPPIWQNSGQNFTVPLFNDNQQRRNPIEMNISALDVNNPQFQRLHFDIQRNNEFIGDDRRGGMLSQQQQPQRDFFQNINNLNNIPSLVNNLGNRFGPAPAMNRGGGSNMSIRPPFTPRLGPMFMRGPIRPGPPGFNFNDRPAFERDESRGGGGRTRNNDNRRSGGRSNWRDDDNNRRSNVSGSGSGNRFQSRDRDNDRQNRDKNDSDGGRGRRDRGKDSGSRTDRDKNHNRGGSRSDRDRSSERDGRKTDGRKSENESMSQNDTNDNKPYRNNSPIRPSEDTEEDWDKELSDHNVDHSSREEINTQNNNENNNENLESWDSGDDENQFDNNNPNLNLNNDSEQLDDYDGNGYDDDNDHNNREYNRNRSRNLNNTADDDMQELLNSSTEESSVVNRDNTKMDNSNVTDENENENQQDIAGELSSSFSNDNNSNNDQVIENSS